MLKTIRSRQAGQALPLVLVFMLVLCIGGLLVFNTGQVVNKKVELTNAADAAAYSVAVEQARAYNLNAYLNRGRVANEVMVAQVVSLNSWLTMVNVSAEMSYQYSLVLQFVPYVGPFFRALGQVARQLSQVMLPMRQGFRTASNALVTGIEAFNKSYALAAEAAIDAGVISAPVMARQVLKDNSPQATLTPLGIGVLAKQGNDARSDFFEKHQIRGTTRTRGGERYRDVIMASRDGFTRDRNSDLGFIIELKFRGGTDMVEYNRWAALDTLDLSVDLFLFSIDLPLGYGGMQAGANSNNYAFGRGIQSQERSPRQPRQQNRSRARVGWYSEYDNQDHRANRRYDAYSGIRTQGWDFTGYMAATQPLGKRAPWGIPLLRDNAGRNAHILTRYEGIAGKDYYDVKANRANTPGDVANARDYADAGPIFTVEAEVGQADARTSTEVGVGRGRLALEQRAQGQKMKALSSSQVYFNRPYNVARFKRRIWDRDQNDRRFEMGSLFSPYWQARLIETPTNTKYALGLGSVL